MDRAVVYTTDTGFLLPSLVSASEVRLQAEGIADVIVAVSGLGPDAMVALREVTDTLRLHVLSIEKEDLPMTLHFNPTHVPASTLLRFGIGAILDRRYAHVIYLDGDTRMVGDITPLLRHTVAAGRILAANDNAWLGYHLRPAHLRRYLRGLGLTSAFEYFNAGVIALRRETMDAMFPKALEYFLENSERCRFHDQSALNAVFRGRRERLSPLFNFISDYAQLGLQHDVAPALAHFTGGAKPWLYDGPPWGSRFSPAYQATVERFPTLACYAAVASGHQSAALRAACSRRKRFYRLAFPIRTLRRHRFLRHLAEGGFAV